MFFYLVGFMFLLWTWPKFTSMVLVPVFLLLVIYRFSRTILAIFSPNQQSNDVATQKNESVSKPATALSTPFPTLEKGSPTPNQSELRNDEQFLAQQRATEGNNLPLDQNELEDDEQFMAHQRAMNA